MLDKRQNKEQTVDYSSILSSTNMGAEASTTKEFHAQGVMKKLGACKLYMHKKVSTHSSSLRVLLSLGHKGKTSRAVKNMREYRSNILVDSKALQEILECDPEVAHELINSHSKRDKHLYVSPCCVHVTTITE